MAPITPKPILTLDTSQQRMPPPGENPRPILKFSTNSRQSSLTGDGATPTPSVEKIIKIKINSQPSTPAPTIASQTPTTLKTKAGRTSRPTAKLAESKKRGYESDDEDTPLAATRAEARPSKTIKLTQKPGGPKGRPSIGASQPVSTPAGTTIRFKPKGEHLVRKHGDAYDSEASDRETDPQRETNFILRVMDGAASQYLKTALAEGTIGQPKANGGADFSVQFIDAKERRAMVTINGIHFAAVLVQLPTITEAMKTWDRKSMMKNSDITEMLLCFAPVASEAEAKMIPLPSMVAKSELKWPHGITPPMHDAPNRRFRKALSEKQWERTQNQVSKLLEDDRAAEDVRAEIIMEDEGDEDYDDEEDAEGEMDMDDYFGDQTQIDQAEDQTQHEALFDAEEEDDLLREFLGGDEDFGNDTPATQLEAPTPLTVGTNTPMNPPEEQVSAEEEEEEISDEDDDDDDEADEDDDGQDRERKQQLGELHELEKQLEQQEKKLQTTTMPILKKRISSSIENLKKEISVKKAALGFAEDD
ncbi:hypothetical protein F5Y17DRAFT_223425 [Xylariaceae sp. FL0594]|nr:hypothetical protein F5Y17DRAFT_223425 [Xylariaceae sp. FL0594]